MSVSCIALAFDLHVDIFHHHTILALPEFGPKSCDIDFPQSPDTSFICINYLFGLRIPHAFHQVCFPPAHFRFLLHSPASWLTGRLEQSPLLQPAHDYETPSRLSFRVPPFETGFFHSVACVSVPVWFILMWYCLLGMFPPPCLHPTSILQSPRNPS